MSPTLSGPPSSTLSDHSWARDMSLWLVVDINEKVKSRRSRDSWLERCVLRSRGFGYLVQELWYGSSFGTVVFLIGLLGTRFVNLLFVFAVEEHN